MSIKKYEANIVAKTLYGIVLKIGEKRKLYEICIKYNVPITYPSLFNDNNHYYLWGISKNGIGLISTVIINYLSDNGRIFHSLEELEDYLKKENKNL